MSHDSRLERLARDKCSSLLGSFSLGSISLGSVSKEIKCCKCSPWSWYVVHCAAIINILALLGRIFVAFSYFYPSLIFAGMAGTYPREAIMGLHSKFRFRLLGPHSQHFILFITEEWARLEHLFLAGISNLV